MSTISLLFTLERVFRLAKNNGEVEDEDRKTMYSVASLPCRYSISLGPLLSEPLPL